MASPVGHALVGVGSAVAVAQFVGAPDSPQLVIGAIFAGNIPDLDFLGPLVGIPSYRAHRHATHSLTFTLGLISLAVGLWSLMPGGVDLGLSLGWGAALVSHLLVDLITTSPEAAARGFGLPLFWPISSKRWVIPQALYHTADFGAVRSLSGKLRAAIPEIYVLGPISVALVIVASLLPSLVDWTLRSGSSLAQFLRLLEDR